MVTSEMVLSSDFLSIQPYGLASVRYILLANILVNIGFKIEPYLIKSSFILKSRKGFSVSAYVGSRQVMDFLFLLALIYFFTDISQSFFVYQEGRNSILEDTVDGEISVLSPIMNGISYFAPISAAFYCRYYLNNKYKIHLILIVVLCAIPQIFYGTRYRLLFTLVSPLIVFFDRKKISFKLISLGFVFLFSMIFLSSYLRNYRDNFSNSSISYEENSVIEKIASFGSNEGVVKRAEHLLRYVDLYGLHYGKESAFVLYFWVPRTLWPEKPTKIGHWLVRMFESVSHKFSAAYGFWGQLFIDFGYLSLVILFFFGGFLKILDLKKDAHLDMRSKVSIVYISFFPVVFFSIRSPQTAVINFLYVVFIFFVFNFIFRFLKMMNPKNKLL